MNGSKDSDTDDTDTKVYDGDDSSSSAHPDVSVRPVEVQDTLREVEGHLSNAMAFIMDEKGDKRGGFPFMDACSARNSVKEAIEARHPDSIHYDVRRAYELLQDSHDDAEFLYPTAYGEYRQAMDKLQAVLAAF